MWDWCFTPKFLEEFQRRFPKAETTRFEEAGHYLFEDAREHLPGVIREFLRQHPS
jgi:haloalkane dehalogenase